MLKQSNKPIRQELMLGLIYPAVLGTILYQLVFTVAHVLREQYPLSAIIWIKWSLVVISIGFYVCDYLYIVFTKRYYWWSFLCDVVFLLALYSTVIAIDVDNPVRPPNHKVILLCYLIFLLVYLVWDGYEFHTLPRGRERNFYRAVVFWELPSVRYRCLRDHSFGMEQPLYDKHLDNYYSVDSNHLVLTSC